MFGIKHISLPLTIINVPYRNVILSGCKAILTENHQKHFRISGQLCYLVSLTLLTISIFSITSIHNHRSLKCYKSILFLKCICIYMYQCTVSIVSFSSYPRDFSRGRDNGSIFVPFSMGFLLARSLVNAYCIVSNQT